MNKTFKKILSVCCTVVTTLTATLFRSTEVRAYNNYKIVFIGDEQVGKTQLVTRIANNKFSDHYKYTVGAVYYGKDITSTVHLDLWEIGGKENFRSFHPIYCNGVHVVLYCCSCEQLKSQTQQRLASSFGIPAGSPVLLCITKTDEVYQSDYKDTNEFNQEKLPEILTQFREANDGCNILSGILVTSAKNNQYNLCTPANYDSPECKDIYQNLAEDLVNLCREQEKTQNPDKSDRNAGKCGDTGNDRAYRLGVPASLVSLALIGGLGCCYGHDRHKTKNKVHHPTGNYIQKENKRKKQTVR